MADEKRFRTVVPGGFGGSHEEVVECEPQDAPEGSVEVEDDEKDE